MTHRNRGRGTYIIDRRFPGIGRLCFASGTTDRKRYRQLDAMLTDLWETGCLDVLRALRDRTVRPLEVWNAYRIHGTRGLHVLERAQDLQTAITAWLPTLAVTERTRRDYQGYLNRLLANVPRATVADLPVILQQGRERVPAPSFNRTRAACLAFLRDTVGKSHGLYLVVRGVPTKTEHRQRGQPLPVEQARMVAGALERLGPQWWTLCCTGLRLTEYFAGAWEVRDDRILIHGRKTAGAERIVPRICVPARPIVKYRAFREALAEYGVKPYDARRTFAHWLELAGVPRSRRMRYLGHHAVDVTGLYEDHSPEYYLVDDRERLFSLVGTGPAALRVVP